MLCCCCCCTFAILPWRTFFTLDCWLRVWRPIQHRGKNLITISSHRTVLKTELNCLQADWIVSSLLYVCAFFFWIFDCRLAFEFWSSLLVELIICWNAPHLLNRAGDLWPATSWLKLGGSRKKLICLIKRSAHGAHLGEVVLIWDSYHTPCQMTNCEQSMIRQYTLHGVSKQMLLVLFCLFCINC